MDIRPLAGHDDLEAELDLGLRAFGPVDRAHRDRRLAAARAGIGEERHYGAFDGQRQVAAAMFHDMRQWWHGRALRMAGVGGVTVAPEQRGRRIGTALMAELLQAIASRGYPLSVLYPATAPIYRSLGWELAGGRWRAVIPARSLARPVPPSASPPAQPRRGLRRAGPDDAGEVIAVIGSVHESARHCGPATFEAETVRRLWLGDESLFCYLAPDGFLGYGWDDGQPDIAVRWALAASAETTRAIWSTVGSHAPVARNVRAVVSPDDPVGWLTREPDLGVAGREPWMMRVVDAAAAVCGRGFPPAAELAVGLQIEDPQLPANAGRWTLEVGGGRGSLSPAGTDGPAAQSPAEPVRFGARGFAALYAGTPMATLRRAGLAAGGDTSADAALDTAFAGKAFLLDVF